MAGPRAGAGATVPAESAPASELTVGLFGAAERIDVTQLGGVGVSDVSAARAKLAGLGSTIEERIKDPRVRYFDPPTVLEYFKAYNRAAGDLKDAYPALLGDLPYRPIPEPSDTPDNDGRGYIERRQLEVIVRDVGYIAEVLDYGAPLAISPAPNGSATLTGKAIDVRDLSLADVWRALTRLKLTSLAFLIGLLLTGALAVAEFVRAQYEPKLATSAAFADAFAIQFADREALHQLVLAILDEHPDGFTTPEEALGSLLWQVKSQSGFAEFLSGGRKTAMQVTFNEDSMNFEWDHGPNPLLQILSAEGLEPSEERLSQLNAELNLLGVAWLDAANYVVRGTDGGLSVVGADE